ncbi:5-methylcytosine restriction system specificity protein McrC [Thermococcus celer]|uniref:5-methylcytosine restriction system specificity protein McrC n=1 Tax=Thermococcus celer TaxID=2264 RepID=UPI000B59FB3F|nr:restriction endonuclease [Thermococcus celer]
MKVVTLHEFQRRYLRSLQAEGLKLHPSELHRFFESINRVYGREHEVLSLKYDVSRGEYYIKTHGSVGFAYHLGDEPFMIQILPKPYRYDPDQRRSMKFFLSLLNMSGNLGMSPRDIELAISAYGDEGELIHELFFYLYVFQLKRRVFHGMYQEYSELEESSKTIRGRVLLSRLIRTAPVGVDVPVRHSALGVDNPLNRVLKAALEVVAENSEWRGIGRAAGSLIEYFRGVGTLDQKDPERVSFNSLNERFKPVYTLATIILTGFSRKTGTNSGQQGVFIDMAHLFEDLAYHTIKRALNGKGVVYRNYTLPHIVKDHGRVEAKLGAVFTLGSPLPDILVVTDSGKCAIEVKYRGLIVKMGGNWWRKLVRSSEDLYQIYSYSRLAGGSAAIVYPRLKGAYNHWIPDMFEPSGELLSFFDGTPFALFGYELSRVGTDVFITRNGVVLRDSIARNLRETLLALCEKREAGNSRHGAGLKSLEQMSQQRD